MFVCKMGVEPRTNLYNIGGDPLTQLIIIFFLFFLFNVWISRHSQKMNGKRFWIGDPLMQSIEYSSLIKTLVINNIVTNTNN